MAPLAEARLRFIDLSQRRQARFVAEVLDGIGRRGAGKSEVRIQVPAASVRYEKM